MILVEYTSGDRTDNEVLALMWGGPQYAMLWVDQYHARPEFVHARHVVPLHRYLPHTQLTAVGRYY